MEVFSQEFSVSTRKQIEIIDVTRGVENAVASSGIKEGLCIIHTPHATAAIIVNEGEEGLIYDITKKIEALFPVAEEYRHNRVDDNAHAHLASAFLGSSKVFPIKNSRILRGTWQNILLVELDGPRTRRIVVTVVGEK
ncbi:YjbQ family protein [Candidatus Bathyarchaeota archaeon]|nr:MAG: YjbQ family protein [Candidatus Bathyarchaeota archaeon]